MYFHLEQLGGFFLHCVCLGAVRGRSGRRARHAQSQGVKCNIQRIIDSCYPAIMHSCHWHASHVHVCYFHVFVLEVYGVFVHGCILFRGMREIVYYV
jgi:hypothetical protein